MRYYSRILSVVQSHSALLLRPGTVALGLGIGEGRGTGVADAGPDADEANCRFQSGVGRSGDADVTVMAVAARRARELRMVGVQGKRVEQETRGSLAQIMLCLCGSFKRALGTIRGGEETDRAGSQWSEKADERSQSVTLATILDRDLSPLLDQKVPKSSRANPGTQIRPLL